MTAVLEPPVGAAALQELNEPLEAKEPPTPTDREPGGDATAATGSHYRALLAVWIVALVAGVGLVIYGFGPLFQARDQRRLFALEKKSIASAANESSGLFGVTTPTQAPAYGAPVAIMEIGRLRLQEAVVEGAKSAQTRSGPAHVAGTAGPGQPGNSVLVGRAHAFGGPFHTLGSVRKGDKILLTTTQGQSVYRAVTITHRSVHPSPTSDVFGPSKDTRLTLVTSASILPWNDSEAIVVVATLEGLPFAPTLQNGRGSPGLGVDGDGDADAAVILSMLTFAATMSASIVLYRHVRPTTAYLLTIGPVMATAIMAGETLSRVFPGWM